MSTLTSQAPCPASMAKHPLPLLLGVWVLVGGLWLEAEAQGAPYGVKLCGREFIRAVIFICGGSRWRRSDNLAQEAMGEVGRSGREGRGTWDMGWAQETGTKMRPRARAGESLLTTCTLKAESLGQSWGVQAISTG